MISFVAYPALHPLRHRRHRCHRCHRRVSPSSTRAPASPPSSNDFLPVALTRTPPSPHFSPAAADRFIPLHGNNILLVANRISRTPLIWSFRQLSYYLKLHSAPMPFLAFLACSTSPVQAFYAVDISHTPPPSPSTHTLLPLRAALKFAQSECQAALLAHASVLLSWHSTCIYCSTCACPTVPIRLGAARTCPNRACSVKNVYPTIMPSVLALVHHPIHDQILLARKSTWAKGRYSVIAGFAEVFESLEQTVVREVEEETGIVVDIHSVQYYASQPWPSSPFPSLMSAFTAIASKQHVADICLDDQELEDAQWFDKTWLRNNLGGAISIPGPTSMARRLILDCLK